MRAFTRAAAIFALAWCITTVVACKRNASPSGEQALAPEPGVGGAIEDSLVAIPAVDWTDVDRGTGIVFFRDWRPAPAADTIRVWRSTSFDSLVALFIREVPSASGYSFRVEQPQTGGAAASNLLEYGYEDLGLPFDSLDTTAGTVRVLYALDSTGAALRGWSRLTPALDHLRWREHLATRSVYFDERVSEEFHESPGGPLLTLDVPSREYEMIPDSATGDWLRVTVRTPHSCSGEAPATESVAWIRYLDSTTRRPRVWYHSRGC